MSNPNRYRLHGYVEPGGMRKRAAWLTDGRMLFKDIYQRRPNDCRYAVVSIWDNSAHGRYFAALDLFDVLKTAENKLIDPEPRWTHENLQALIATTVLLYGDKEVQQS